MLISSDGGLTLKEALNFIEACLSGTTLTPEATLADCGVESSQQLQRFRAALLASLIARGQTVARELLVLAPRMRLAQVATLVMEATKPLSVSGKSPFDHPVPIVAGWPERPGRGRMVPPPLPLPPPRQMRSPGAFAPPRPLNLGVGPGSPPRILQLRSGRGPMPGWKSAPAKKAAAKKAAAKKAPAKNKAAAPSPEASPTKEVRATPHLVFTGEPSPRSPQVYPLALFLDQGVPDEGAQSEPVQFNVPVETTTCSIGVSFRCSMHFKIKGLPKNPALTLEIASGTSDRLKCGLQVLPITDAMAANAEPRFVAAYFTRNGRPCGKVLRQLQMAGSKPEWAITKKIKPKTKAKARSKKSSDVVLPNNGAAGALVVDVGAVASDLRVTVLSRSLRDKTLYSVRCEFRAEHVDADWELPLEARDQVEALTDRFMAPEDHGAIASLRSTGRKYWKILPEAVKVFVKAALANGAKTLFVLSEEPWIPWELMIPDLGPDAPSMPLGALLAAGRWVTGNHLPPPQEIRLNSIYLVSPRDSELENAADEVKYFEKELKKRVLVKQPSTPVTLKKLDDGLPLAACDGLHFICHGKRLKSLQLLNFDDETDLDCSQLTDLDGFRAAFKAHPFVFLNACEVGGVVPSLDGVTGFANSFIELQASAVVAPLWAVRDAAAPHVTRSFYEAVLEGKPFGEAIRVIREQAYQSAGDRETYAAYCYYGDPLARLAAAAPAAKNR